MTAETNEKEFFSFINAAAGASWGFRQVAIFFSVHLLNKHFRRLFNQIIIVD